MAADFISYQNAGKFDPAGAIQRVYYGMRRVGTIMKVDRGFQYFPIGRDKSSAEIFQTIDEVKKSLQ